MSRIDGPHRRELRQQRKAIENQCADDGLILVKIFAEHGGKREGAGRKPLADGISRRLFSLTPRHNELLEQYRQRHGLPSASAALRHLIESCET